MAAACTRVVSRAPQLAFRYSLQDVLVGQASEEASPSAACCIFWGAAALPSAAPACARSTLAQTHLACLLARPSWCCCSHALLCAIVLPLLLCYSPPHAGGGGDVGVSFVRVCAAVGASEARAGRACAHRRPQTASAELTCSNSLSMSGARNLTSTAGRYPTCVCTRGRGGGRLMLAAWSHAPLNHSVRTPRVTHRLFVGASHHDCPLVRNVARLTLEIIKQTCGGGGRGGVQVEPGGGEAGRQSKRRSQHTACAHRPHPHLLGRGSAGCRQYHCGMSPAKPT